MSDFKLEKEMTPIVTKSMQGRGYIVRPEMIGANNCDLVGCKFNMENARLRIKQRQKTPLNDEAFWAMERQNKVREWMPLFDDIVTIELKLSRIGEVIDQAAVHKWYAIRSYIAMPLDIARRAIQKAIPHGIGVIGVSSDGIETLLPAQVLHHYHCMRTHKIAEVFWRYHRNELG